METPIEYEDVQTLIVNDYRSIGEARFLRLRFDAAAAAGRFVRELAPRVTTGVAAIARPAIHVAFTHPGLEALGLDGEILACFSRPFREGMHTPHRQRVLGDVVDNDPRDWEWGFPAADYGARRVDALLLVYADDEPRVERAVAELRDLPGADGIRFDPLPIPRMLWRGGEPGEHFGFVDGIGNPAIDGKPQAVAPGEILLGYPNESGRLSESPRMAPGAGAATAFPRGDFGRNGSYLVVRQLEQRVREFWAYLSMQSPEAGGPVRLAAKMVGRWPNGAPLARWSEHVPAERQPADDDFGYASDPAGLRCPIGAHIRRANPRDAVPFIDDASASLRISRRHRILRRGRPYGEPLGGWPDPEAMRAASGPDTGRGLHFLCFNADIESQFEFIQQSWLGSRKFAGMANDADPLVSNPVWPANGGASDFTIPEFRGPRRLRSLPQFVHVRGGAYFFMPGRRTLRYLGGIA